MEPRRAEAPYDAPRREMTFTVTVAMTNCLA